jgi:hypothetical protein
MASVLAIGVKEVRLSRKYQYRSSWMIYGLFGIDLNLTRLLRTLS